MKQQQASTESQTDEQAPKGSGFFRSLFCTHDWDKRPRWHQPERSKGETAWECIHCGKKIKLKNWRTPE